MLAEMAKQLVCCCRQSQCSCAVTSVGWPSCLQARRVDWSCVLTRGLSLLCCCAASVYWCRRSSQAGPNQQVSSQLNLYTYLGPTAQQWHTSEDTSEAVPRVCACNPVSSKLDRRNSATQPNIQPTCSQPNAQQIHSQPNTQSTHIRGTRLMPQGQKPPCHCSS